MLIDNHLLMTVLTQYDVRNKFIQNLLLSSENDKRRLYKFVLAFWLGDNACRAKISIQNNNCMPYVYAGYFCLLAIEKELSLLSRHSPSFSKLSHCYRQILACYNNHYLWLTQNPEKLFLAFQAIVNDMDDEEKVKETCLAELSRIFLDENKDFFCPTKATASLSNDKASMNILMGKVITFSFTRYDFFYNGFNVKNNDYLIHKIIIPSVDGVILDGLLARKRGSVSKSMVLALVGHFQSEANYLAEGVICLRNLFGVDTVFVNHRNYSPRSNKFSQDPIDIVNDVISFVKYFKRERKDIVLYGMCGGAAPMIMAADVLRKEKIPFKIIVDRFPSRYKDFADIKTAKRTVALGHTVLSEKGSLLSYFTIVLLIPVFFMFLFLMRVLLVLTKNNMNFAEIISRIPEQDVLILQAKGKKQDGKAEPSFTDVVVHPKNDIRFAFKDRRHASKRVLKDLCGYCQEVERFLSDEPAFRELSLFFIEAINLINNEKLITKLPFLTETTDLHSFKLYLLETRNRPPISSFLRGFFLPSKTTCNESLAHLKSYSMESINAALYKLHPDLSSFALVNVTRFLFLLLKEIKENEGLIARLANRLLGSDVINLNAIIQDLLKTPLFCRLSEPPPSLAITHC